MEEWLGIEQDSPLPESGDVRSKKVALRTGASGALSGRLKTCHTSREVTPRRALSSLTAVMQKPRFSRQTCEVNQTKTATKRMIARIANARRGN
ncbi:hypothetical protein [Neorhizobium tomejilense]|uniref:hypothetical protein n=1 Tax=Neorhizobium tomejilense TaxID=2093828 RepID=UPI003ECE050A